MSGTIWSPEVTVTEAYLGPALKYDCGIEPEFAEVRPLPTQLYKYEPVPPVGRTVPGGTPVIDQVTGLPTVAVVGDAVQDVTTTATSTTTFAVAELPSASKQVIV